jgi:hypothetical protein
MNVTRWLWYAFLLWLLAVDLTNDPAPPDEPDE